MWEKKFIYLFFCLLLEEVYVFSVAKKKKSLLFFFFFFFFSDHSNLSLFLSLLQWHCAVPPSLSRELDQAECRTVP